MNNNTLPQVLRNPEVAEAGGNANAVAVERKTITLTSPTTGVPEIHQLDENDTPYIVKDGVVLKVNKLGGDAKDIMFYSPEYTSIDDLRNRFGDQALLDELNASILRGIRRKVKNSKVPNFADEKAQAAAIEKIRSTEPIQFTQEEALAFKPGEREITYSQVLAMVRTAMKEGASRKEIHRLLKLQQEVMDRDMRRRGLDIDGDDE